MSKRKNGKKKVSRRVYRNPQHFPLTRVPRSKAMMYPTPAEFDTTLMFSVSFVLTQATGSALSYAAVRFYTNAAYSPDIVTPSNKPNGFTALSSLYGSYRVIGYNYKIMCYTRETFGFTMLVRHTNTDPGTASGQMAYAGEALSVVRQVPKTGAPPVTVSGFHSIAEVTGRPIEFDDIPTADVSTIPSDLTFLGIFIQALTETFTTSNGGAFEVQLRLKTRFFNRKQVNDSQPANYPFILYPGDGGETRVVYPYKDDQ